MIVEHVRLFAMLIAACSGWAVVRVAGRMGFEGVGLADGGGYAALLLVGVMINLAAVTVALS